MHAAITQRTRGRAATHADARAFRHKFVRCVEWFLLQLHTVHRRSQRGRSGEPRPQKEVEKIYTTVLAVQKRQIYVKVLRLVIVNVIVTKYVSQKCQWGIYGYQVCFFKLSKTRFRPGSFSAGASPRASLGELTTLPQTL